MTFFRFDRLTGIEAGDVLRFKVDEGATSGDCIAVVFSAMEERLESLPAGEWDMDMSASRVIQCQC